MSKCFHKTSFTFTYLFMFTFPFHIYIEGYGSMEWGQECFANRPSRNVCSMHCFSSPREWSPCTKVHKAHKVLNKAKHEAIREHLPNKNGGLTVVGPVSISPTLFSLVLRYFSGGKVPKYSGRRLLTLLIGQCPKLYIFSHCFLAC